MKIPKRNFGKDVDAVIGVGKQIIRGAKKLNADYKKAHEAGSKNSRTRKNLEKYGHNYY